MARMRAALKHVADALLEEAERREKAVGFRPSLLTPPVRLVAAPARFVPAQARKDPDDALMNGGLHMRALWLPPRHSSPPPGPGTSRCGESSE